MIEKIFLGLILLFFIVAFAVRNIKTYLSTRQAIKGKSKKISASIILSTLIYLYIAARLVLPDVLKMLEISLPFYPIAKYIGICFIISGFIIGIFALLAMKNSWRVGIRYDQKTDLVTSGIYRISRNPYFSSYDILILGYILIFPSPMLFVLYIALLVIFHKMILEEEKYLETIHGEAYEDYKSKVGRYLTIK